MGEYVAARTSTNGVRSPPRALPNRSRSVVPAPCVGHLNPGRARRWGAVIQPFRQVGEGGIGDVSERIWVRVDDAIHADPRTALIPLGATNGRQCAQRDPLDFRQVSFLGDWRAAEIIGDVA